MADNILQFVVRFCLHISGIKPRNFGLEEPIGRWIAPAIGTVAADTCTLEHLLSRKFGRPAGDHRNHPFMRVTLRRGAHKHPVFAGYPNFREYMAVSEGVEHETGLREERVPGERGNDRQSQLSALGPAKEKRSLARAQLELVCPGRKRLPASLKAERNIRVKDHPSLPVSRRRQQAKGSDGGEIPEGEL